MQTFAVKNRENKNVVWRLISLIFHPIFIPIYLLYILVFLHPVMFSGFSESEKWRTIIISIINLVFFPLLTVFLLKALGFIQSFFLHTQKDRIIPFIAFGIFSFWAYTVFKNQSQYPREWPAFIFGVFLASSAGLIANIYNKVSMHAIGMGGWLAFILLLVYTNNFPIPWLVAIVLILTGLVCTARLKTNSHTDFEVYLGLFIGVVAQLIAWWWAT